jgi:uncharacterized membrane protein
MTTYEFLRLVHILSATVLFGTGLGTAYFLWMAHRSRDIHTLRNAARHAILADWWFTTPAVVIQPVTGVLLMLELDSPFTTPWFALVAMIYVAIGACWIPVIFIQYKLRDFAMQAPDYTALPPAYFRAMRTWVLFGIPAFLGVLALYGLMVVKTWVFTLL